MEVRRISAVDSDSVGDGIRSGEEGVDHLWDGSVRAIRKELGVLSHWEGTGYPELFLPPQVNIIPISIEGRKFPPQYRHCPPDTTDFM